MSPDMQKKAQAIQKQNTAPHKLMAEKRKKKLEETAQFGSTEGVIDHPSPIRRHMKWKMAHTKKTEQMTYEATKKIVEKLINSLEEQASQGSFVPHGREDVLTAAIGQPEHPGRSQCDHQAILWIGSTDLPHFFLHGSRRTRAADSTNQGLAGGVDHRKSDLAIDVILQPDTGLAMPLEPEVGPSGARVSTKGSCVDPSPTDPDMGDSDKCGLYIEENPSRLVGLGRVYEGSTAVHNIPLLHDQVKVCVKEVKDAEALVPVPTDETVVSPAKPANGPDPQVHDPLYLMTLTIPQLFLKPLQVMWDATVFGVFNEHFPLYIKHEDLSEIAHDGQCLSISVIQLWILHLTKTSMRAGNFNVYRFLEPQSIQRSGQLQFESESYMRSSMQSSKRDVYLGAYLNGAHWQMVIILPKENLVVWFCSLHNRPDNYLKGIISMSVLFFNTFALALLNNINILMFLVFNNALKGLDDTSQPKSKVAARWIVVKCNRQKGSTECGYYVMHWMSTIILGSFRNNWETTIGSREIEY
ncbi:hypothetical protein HKD37_17G048037 [Glycine soja]